MSNSCFVTVQCERKRLMPAGIEDMLVDLTDAVTQIGLRSVVSRPDRDELTYPVRVSAQSINFPIRSDVELQLLLPAA
jgi:hypothetical protein